MSKVSRITPTLPSATEANLIEDVRKMGAALRELLQRIGTHIDEQHEHAQSTRDLAEMERLQEADPLRWHADATRSLSAGIMYAQRAMEQPAAF